MGAANTKRVRKPRKGARNEDGGGAGEVRRSTAVAPEGTARARRAGVITLGNGRYRVPGLDRTFSSLSAATTVAEARQSQQRSAEAARFR